MTNTEKLIQQHFNELGDKTYSKQSMRDLVQTLADNDLNEDETNSALKKVRRKIAEDIQGKKNLSQSDKTGWTSRMMDELDSGLTETYPPVINTEKKDNRDRKLKLANDQGYESYEDLEASRREDKWLWNPKTGTNDRYEYNYELEMHTKASE